MKALSILLFAIVAVPAMALDMTAWRGETVNAFLPDGENVAEARGGFEVKVGALKGVDYNQAPVIWRTAHTLSLAEPASCPAEPAPWRRVRMI